MGINDPSGMYKSISSPFVKLLMQTMKLSTGDKTPPVLGADMRRRLAGQPGSQAFLMFWLTLLWLFQMGLFGFLFVYIQAHFFQLIEKHYGKMKLYAFRSKAKFNEENF